MPRQVLLLVAVILVVVMVASGCGNSITAEPRAIDPTLDACPICRMSIIDQRFAGQVIDHLGYAESFDDIGCLVLHLKRLGAGGEQGLLATYVKDFGTTEWISAEDAIYVQGRIDTPMSFGIVAFASAEAAGDLAKKIDGRLLTWEEVLQVKFDIGFEEGIERQKGETIQGR